MPRLFRTNSSFVILFLTPGLCKSVCNMISENESTKAQSAFANLSALSEQNFSANFSIMRSIFCASPGSRKHARKVRRAQSSSMPLKCMLSMMAFKTLMLSGLFSPRKSPSAVLSTPMSMFLKKSAMATGSSFRKPCLLRCSRPRLGFMLNLLMPNCSSFFRCFSSDAVPAGAGGALLVAATESLFSPSSSSVSSVCTDGSIVLVLRDGSGAGTSSSTGSFLSASGWSSASFCVHSTTELTSFTSAWRASMRRSRSCCALMMLECSGAVYLPCAILDRMSMMRSKMFFSSTSQSKFKKISTADDASEQSLKKACSERYLCS
mmetsp:Transcript_86463/g.222710  ORF Transcript_86463/g.222710 Transcript_86463/m.222710 type:complete len:321 (-) Transcript_86463:611-1573(-)